MIIFLRQVVVNNVCLRTWAYKCCQFTMDKGFPNCVIVFNAANGEGGRMFWEDSFRGVLSWWVIIRVGIVRGVGSGVFLSAIR